MMTSSFQRDVLAWLVPALVVPCLAWADDQPVADGGDGPIIPGQITLDTGRTAGRAEGASPDLLHVYGCESTTVTWLGCSYPPCPDLIDCSDVVGNPHLPGSMGDCPLGGSREDGLVIDAQSSASGRLTVDFQVRFNAPPDVPVGLYLAVFDLAGAMVSSEWRLVTAVDDQVQGYCWSDVMLGVGEYSLQVTLLDLGVDLRDYPRVPVGTYLGGETENYLLAVTEGDWPGALVATLWAAGGGPLDPAEVYEHGERAVWGTCPVTPCAGPGRGLGGYRDVLRAWGDEQRFR
ncbi:MAG: hypothetical protein AAF533_29540 [Acidobacteriota bacterium]